MANYRDIMETGYVRITNTPISCCGVLQHGWSGKIAYILEVSGMLPDVHSDIIILDDGTLAWSHNVEVIDKPCEN